MLTDNCPYDRKGLIGGYRFPHIAHAVREDYWQAERLGDLVRSYIIQRDTIRVVEHDAGKDDGVAKVLLVLQLIYHILSHKQPCYCNRVAQTLVDNWDNKRVQPR